MGRLINEDKQVDMPDGEALADHAEAIGVEFGCYSGACGTCRIEILKGMENLSDPSEEEVDFGLEGAERLTCQCTLNQGEVSLRPVH